ncbi:MAG TPA: hypothetical protein PKD24_12855 [Pyrinomonadaceae bacterium]|nr:hypothetical protein [Pyrinomonadaceae bacterium]HMP65630.1 hypothetical protein [Pyrinomonadaceae bacterium]
MSNRERKLGRRGAVFLWLGATAIVIMTLVYLEQIALLYLVATVGLIVLLLVVAFSDLESLDRETAESFARGKD